MKNLAKKIKTQHAGNLQKIIQMCQNLIKIGDSDTTEIEEFENLVERLTQAETNFSIQSNEREKLENQMNILMNLMKIPEEKRNFLELKNGIEKLQSDYIGEKERADKLSSKPPKDVMVQDIPKKATLENIIINPGLQHLTENIFRNLNLTDLESCRLINQSSKQILENPIFWLKKFVQRSLSKKNQEDWIKAIQLNTDSDLEKNIVSYLKWKLKKNEFITPPC